MNKEIIETLKRQFGQKVEVRPINELNQIPFVFKEKYDFYLFILDESKYVIIDVKNKLENINTIKKHLSIFRESFQMEPIIFSLELSYFRRIRLQEERISYIDGQNVYIKNNLLIQRPTKVVKFNKTSLSALSQSIIRYFLLENELEINVSEMARKIHITEMSASRGLKELHDFGFLEYSIGGKTGRSKSYRLKKSNGFFERILSLSKTPVESTVYAYSIPEKAVVSGLTALSSRTNVSDDGRKVVALHKHDLSQLNIPVFHDSFTLDLDQVIEIQGWSYQPNMYPKDDWIDDFSLTCLFKDTEDERISIELEKLERKHGWSME